MQRIRLLFSLLCAVCALVVALVKPLSSRADDTTPAPAPPAPTPVDVNPVIPPLPVIRPKPARKTAAKSAAKPGSKSGSKTKEASA